MQKNGFFNHNLTFFSSYFHTFFQFPHIPYGILHDFVFKKRFLNVQKTAFCFLPTDEN